MQQTPWRAIEITDMSERIKLAVQHNGMISVSIAYLVGVEGIFFVICRPHRVHVLTGYGRKHFAGSCSDQER